MDKNAKQTRTDKQSNTHFQGSHRSASQFKSIRADMLHAE